MTSHTDHLPSLAVGHDPLVRQRVYDQVCELLAVHLGLPRDALTPASRLDEDLAVDSLDLLDFGLVLKDRHQIELGLDILRLADTVDDLTSLVAAAGSEQLLDIKY